jgi:hypothetical protein
MLAVSLVGGIAARVCSTRWEKQRSNTSDSAAAQFSLRGAFAVTTVCAAALASLSQPSPVCYFFVAMLANFSLCYGWFDVLMRRGTRFWTGFACAMSVFLVQPKAANRYADREIWLEGMVRSLPVVGAGSWLTEVWLWILIGALYGGAAAFFARGGLRPARSSPGRRWKNRALLAACAAAMLMLAIYRGNFFELLLITTLLGLYLSYALTRCILRPEAGRIAFCVVMLTWCFFEVDLQASSVASSLANDRIVRVTDYDALTVRTQLVALSAALVVAGAAGLLAARQYALKPLLSESSEALAATPAAQT